MFKLNTVRDRRKEEHVSAIVCSQRSILIERVNVPSRFNSLESHRCSVV